MGFPVFRHTWGLEFYHFWGPCFVFIRLGWMECIMICLGFNLDFVAWTTFFSSSPMEITILARLLNHNFHMFCSISSPICSEHLFPIFSYIFPHVPGVLSRIFSYVPRSFCPHHQDTLSSGDGLASPELVTVLAEQSAETHRWLKSLGASDGGGPRGLDTRWVVTGCHEFGLMFES